MADSTAEYLPKQFMLLGGLDGRYQVMYDKMLTAAERYLFYRPLVPGDPSILFSGNTGVDDEGIVVTESQGQHLTCFAGGMVGLAAKVFDRPQDMRVAKELVEGCICAYNSTPTGLMPETFHIASCHVGTGVPVGDECDFTEEKWYKAVAKQHGGGFSKPLAESGKSLADQHSLVPGFTKWGDNRYILRPEAIESVFILYRLTGDQHFLDTAWIMWNNIVKHCKTPFAFAGIPDVRIIPPAQSDRMESFWLAETLKYFIWIYSEPSEYSLDDWVLNTEAHL